MHFSVYFESYIFEIKRMRCFLVLLQKMYLKSNDRNTVQMGNDENSAVNSLYCKFTHMQDLSIEYLFTKCYGNIT